MLSELTGKPLRLRLRLGLGLGFMEVRLGLEWIRRMGMSMGMGMGMDNVRIHKASIDADRKNDKKGSISWEDREFVREELSWLAEWIRKRYPGLNFADARRILREILSASV